MAIFVCGADESADQNPRGRFFYGGFSAPVSDWNGCFADAWNERVLKGPPPIPHLHMTEVLSPSWRSRHGVTGISADQRLDEASRVIRSTGSLIPVVFSLSEQEYDDILRRPFVPQSKKSDESLDPDYLCFMFFVHTQLHWLQKSRLDIDRVDFWVEQNGKITRYISQFYEDMRSKLLDVNRPDLAMLLGNLIPVDKHRIPVQAADILLWHARNHERDALNALETHRYWRMIEGMGSGFRGRYGHQSEIGGELLRDLADAFTAAERRSANDTS